MSDEPTPLVPPSHGGLGERILRAVFPVALGVSLWVSPRPAALLVRRVFAVGGAKTAEGLGRHTPGDVIALLDERYGDEPDMLLDVYRPASASTPLPLFALGSRWRIRRRSQGGARGLLQALGA